MLIFTFLLNPSVHFFIARGGIDMADLEALAQFEGQDCIGVADLLYGRADPLEPDFDHAANFCGSSLIESGGIQTGKLDCDGRIVLGNLPEEDLVQAAHVWGQSSEIVDTILTKPIPCLYKQIEAQPHTRRI